jgi:SAM-dependent methyltransferase
MVKAAHPVIPSRMGDTIRWNRDAWDRAVEERDRWTVPVSPEAIAEARRGELRIGLTARKLVPRDWFPPSLAGVRVLGLASAGGQQLPLLAACGARVTSFDLSPRQLAQDRAVADREGLALETVEGDMRDLSAFADASFDLVFHPVSNLFVPDVAPVWRESFRVLRPGGVLLAGFANPILFMFDRALETQDVFTMRYPLPYSDLGSLTPEERHRFVEEIGQPYAFGHSLEAQIGGQLAAGFVLTGMYEDEHVEGVPINAYLPTFIATRAMRPE